MKARTGKRLGDADNNPTSDFERGLQFLDYLEAERAIARLLRVMTPQKIYSLALRP